MQLRVSEFKNKTTVTFLNLDLVSLDRVIDTLKRQAPCKVIWLFNPLSVGAVDYKFAGEIITNVIPRLELFPIVTVIQTHSVRIPSWIIYPTSDKIIHPLWFRIYYNLIGAIRPLMFENRNHLGLAKGETITQLLQSEINSVQNIISFKPADHSR